VIINGCRHERTDCTKKCHVGADEYPPIEGVDGVIEIRDMGMVRFENPGGVAAVS
jgi:hypothetical protein